jgi:uncharacterized integral membrane protein
MDKAAFDKYLAERYEPQVEWYDRKAIWNQRVYTGFQWTVIVLGAITPVLVAVGGEWQRWSAVVVGSLVAIGIAGLKTFKYQENWVNYRTTCETLRKEIHYLQAGVDAYRGAANPAALFVERVEALIARENSMWLSIRKPEEETGGPPPE